MPVARWDEFELAEPDNAEVVAFIEVGFKPSFHFHRKVTRFEDGALITYAVVRRFPYRARFGTHRTQNSRPASKSERRAFVDAAWELANLVDFQGMCFILVATEDGNSHRQYVAQDVMEAMTALVYYMCRRYGPDTEWKLQDVDCVRRCAMELRQYLPDTWFEWCAATAAEMIISEYVVCLEWDICYDPV